MQRDLKKYEAMAKLRFDDKESAWALSAFERILADFQKLDDISTEDIEPLIYISNDTNALRYDEVILSNLQELSARQQHLQ